MTPLMSESPGIWDETSFWDGELRVGNKVSFGRRCPQSGSGRE